MKAKLIINDKDLELCSNVELGSSIKIFDTLYTHTFTIEKKEIKKL
jgi:hypothetical protein